MKRLLITFHLFLLSCLVWARGTEDFEIVFWNLENFFDYIDGGSSESDSEFSSGGSRHWNRKRFYAKCNAVAKTVMWIAGKEGKEPEIIAVAEIENDFVLRSLVYSTPLQKFDYKYIHYDSPDPRGIDVGILYRSSALKLISSAPLRLQKLQTRDILLAQFLDSKGDSLALLVNHHPSKYGGSDTDWKRQVALERLSHAVDSLSEAGYRRIVATGDFNDGPETVNMEPKLENLAAKLATRGQGSIRYNGIWELIDMFLVSKELAERSTMEVLHVPFLTVWDNSHAGEKPFRTYIGPRYVGGVSDHCPILLRLNGYYSPQ